MPKRPDIEKVLVPGSGPIVIGQAAEFPSKVQQIDVDADSTRNRTSSARILSVTSLWKNSLNGHAKASLVRAW